MAMTAVELARVASAKATLAGLADGGLRMLLAGVPDGVLIEVVELCCDIMGVTVAEVWSPRAVLPLLSIRVEQAFSSAGVAIADVMRRYEKSCPAEGLPAAVLADLPERGKDGHRQQGGLTPVGRAVEAMALSEGALPMLEQLNSLSLEAECDAELRKQVMALEQGPVMGAELALLLHQESLEVQPKGANLSQRAQRVYTLVRDVKPRLLAARTRYWEELMPEGVKVGELVEKVNSGAFTLQMLVPAGAKGNEPRAMHVLRGWAALVELVVESHPRDATARPSLLRMGRDAYPVGVPLEAAPLQLAIGAVLERYETRFKSYLAGVVSEPDQWSAVSQKVAATEGRSALLRFTHQAVGKDGDGSKKTMACGSSASLSLRSHGLHATSLPA